MEITKKQVEQLLSKAYLETLHRLEIGFKHPKSMLPSWEIIKNGHDTNESLDMDPDFLGMYEICVAAAEEYDRREHIGLDSAFSTILCEICIQHKSVEWYRIMAYHYGRVAEKKGRTYETTMG